MPKCSLILPLLLTSLSALANTALGKEVNDPTDLQGDTPDLHIIAVDKDGDLCYPNITQNGEPITKWSPKPFDLQLDKFDSPDADLAGNSSSSEGKQGTVAGRSASAFLKNMMDAIKKRKREIDNDPSIKDKQLHIVIHIHGGMNSITGAVQAAAHGYWVMEKEEEKHNRTIYPIFICWNSEPLSCYWDHLCFDRSGYSLRDSDAEFLGFLTAPLFLIGDVGTGIARGPSIAIEQGINDYKTVSPQLYPENMNYVPMFEERKREIIRETRKTNGEPKQAMHVEEGADNFDLGDGAWNATKYTATLPLKLFAGGVIDGLGPGAWAEMKRRVDLMFWKQEQLLPYCKDESFVGPLDEKNLDTLAHKQRHKVGGAAFFLGALKKQVLLGIEPCPSKPTKTSIIIHAAKLQSDINSLLSQGLKDGSSLSEEQYNVLKSRLAELCQQDSSLSNQGYDVSLIGHSMGAIVINEMLENDPNFPYRKIVYMAAACSVKDFQDTVIPYLEDHSDCQFYNLCLNPEAELRNIEFYEALPRGGLLNWINDIFEGPPDMRHRMYGQFITSINTSDIIPRQIRGQVYMKAFGFGTNPTCYDHDVHFQEGFPHNHGEFNSFGTSREQAFTGSSNGEKMPVQFEGNRPATANPHGFWTDDFLWYNRKDQDALGEVNPLTLQSKKNPDLQPGYPDYLNAFAEKSWQIGAKPCTASSFKPRAGR